MSSFVSEDKPVEVVFAFDTTGSMSSFLRQVSYCIKNLKEKTNLPTIAFMWSIRQKKFHGELQC